MKLLTLLLTLCSLAPFAYSQERSYAVLKLTSLTASAEKITVQVPSSGGRQINLESANVYCSVACVVTLYQDGSVATTTALAVTTRNLSAPATQLAFSGSDSTGGKTLDAYNIPAGGTIRIDLTDLKFGLAGQNFSIGTDAITGDVRITIRSNERGGN